MKLFIKYMVSNRCKMIVREELKKMGLHYVTVNLGEVEIMENITQQQREQIKVALLKSGLELMDNKKAILIEKIKSTVVEMVHNLFSEATGTTIEHYIINHKIERVKEFILYDELNLTQISYKLHYSSVAHLSKQFKKVTGLTPTYFRQLKHKKRTTLENV